MTTVAPITKRRAIVKMFPAGRGQRAPRLRLDFTYDGTTVSARDPRQGTEYGPAVVTAVEQGGCGCGGKLGLTFTLESGDVWTVQ